MKKILFVALLLTLIVFEIKAQRMGRAGFEVRTYDTSANQFFEQNSNIKHISIHYYNGMAQVLYVYYKGRDVNRPDEKYTLTFEGDVHLFNKKFKTFPFPRKTVAKLHSLDGFINLKDSTIVYTNYTTIKPDSLTQHFSFYTVKGKAIPDFFPEFYRPTLKGSILELTKKLETEFKQWKPLKVTDSIIVLTGLVDKEGKIGKLSLIDEAPSEYSNKVLDFMTRVATSWNPRIAGGALMRSEVKISVRINKDDSVKISIL